MRAGELRHRVTIQSETRTSDGAGGATITWENVATVSAAVRPLSGRELFEAQKQNPKLSHEVEIRYRSGVTPKNRILFKGRVLNIQYIRNAEERNRQLFLMCEELVA